MSEKTRPGGDSPEEAAGSSMEPASPEADAANRTDPDPTESSPERIARARAAVNGQGDGDDDGKARDEAGPDEAAEDAESSSFPAESVSVGRATSDEAVLAKRARRRHLLLVGLIAFSLGSGGVGYWAWRQLQSLEERFEARSRENANEVKAAMETELSVQRRELADAVTHLGTVADTVERLDQAAGALRTEVDTVSVRLAEAVESDPTELLFAELDYLLRIANHRLALEHDREGAIIALTRAEWRLAGIDSPMLDPVRARLVADRAALEAAPAPTLDDVFAAIETLIDSIDHLRGDAQRIAPEGESPAAEERQETGWHAFLSAISHDLAQFVVVKRADGAVAPQLIPDQEYLVRENLRLTLENARSAALRHDTGNFHRSLEEAQRWLSGYFSPGDSTVAAMSSEIRRLSALDLQPPLPDISGSIELVARLSGASILRDAGRPGATAPEKGMEVEVEALPAPSGEDGSHSESDPESTEVEAEP